MYPSIRPKDNLKLLCCSVEQAAIGDLVVCRSSHFLYCHRVISTGQDDGKSFLITQADRSPKPDTTPVYHDSFIGIVVAIIRNGVQVPFQLSSTNRDCVFYNRLSLYFLTCQDRAKLFIDRLGSFLINRFPLKILFKFFLTLSSKQYAVRVPLFDTLCEDNTLYKSYDLDQFNPYSSFKGNGLKRWLLVVHINGSSKPSGFAEVSRNNCSEQWEVNSVCVMFRYQSTNLPMLLKLKARSILIESR